jgi:two-component system OmpR family response regulator
MPIVEIDHDRFAVLVDGKRAKLTRSEYFAVAFLALHPGYVRSRVQIADAYSDRPYASDKAVDTLIKRIRLKIRPLGVDPIETHSGFGYSWKEAIGTRQYHDQ